MPQFHETGYGRTFFGGQLPNLIKGIQQATEAIKASNEINAALLEELKRQNNQIGKEYFTDGDTQ